MIYRSWEYVESKHQQCKALGIKGGATRCFWRFTYQADSWRHLREVIAKIKVTDKDRNPWFIVTNLPDSDSKHYYEEYCTRGDMENQIVGRCYHRYHHQGGINEKEALKITHWNSKTACDHYY